MALIIQIATILIGFECEAGIWILLDIDGWRKQTFATGQESYFGFDNCRLTLRIDLLCAAGVIAFVGFNEIFHDLLSQE